MAKQRSKPFEINLISADAIRHINTTQSVPASHPPRGVYFQVDCYDDCSWYIKNHYDNPNLGYGRSTINILNKQGEVEGHTLLDHLIYRVRRASHSNFFIALDYNLKLHLYLPNAENIATCAFPDEVASRDHIRSIDISENGRNVFIPNWNKIIRLDQKLEITGKWELPINELKKTETSSPAIKEALSILHLVSKPSLGEIKSSFRKELLLFHPDINPTDPLANDKTRRIVEAYKLLSEGEFPIVEDSKDISQDESIDDFIQVALKFTGDHITAIRESEKSGVLFVGCYSGKIYRVDRLGTFNLIYNCRERIDDIKEFGKYFHIFSDWSWEILRDGVIVNRIPGHYFSNRLIFEENCIFERVGPRINMFSPGGILFGGMEFTDSIAGIFYFDQQLRVLTSKKTYIFHVDPPTDYRYLTEKIHYI
jgi:hypothetical protein